MEYAAFTVTTQQGRLTQGAYVAGFAENPQGPAVICLHGFPDTARTFFKQSAAMVAAGYRVVAPMLRGYEPLSQPASGDYSLLALSSDVVALMDALLMRRAHIIGHDWGAAIGYTVAAQAPNRCLSLVAMAVPHSARFFKGIRRVPSQLKKSWYMNFFQLRGVAERRLAKNDWALVKRLWRDWSPGYELSQGEFDWLRQTFAAPGVNTAMLAYYRQNASPRVLLGLGKSSTAELTEVPVPTLAITGADDGCIDTRMFDYVFLPEDFPAGVRIERVKDAGHFVHLEQPQLINLMLLDWLANRRT